MDQNWILFLLGQSVIIIGAIVAGHIRVQVAMARISAELDGIRNSTQDLKRDHIHLTGQVGGISRGLARLEGRIGVKEIETISPS